MERGMQVGRTNERNGKGIREKGGKDIKVQKGRRARYEETKEIVPR
jgi:hypothetical protein